MKCLILIFSLFSLGSTQLQCEEEEMVVFVKSKQSFSTVYISPFILKSTSLDPSYLDQLQRALYFDFSHNGYSEIKPRSEEIDSLIETNAAKLPDSLPAKHTLRFEVEGYSLKPTLFAYHLPLGVTLDHVVLTGILEKDLAAVHTLADRLHLVMYKQPGIASKRIAYSETEENNPDHGEIFVKYPDTFEGKQVTHEESFCINPVLLGDCNHMIYTCYKNGPPKLYKMALGEPVGHPIVSLSGNQLLPAISSTDQLIAFISDAAGKPDLFIQRLSRDQEAMGKPQQVYSHHTAVQSSSSFSPDTTKLAMVSDQSGTPRVYIMNLFEALRSRSKPKLQCITNINRENVSPSWSPDGKKLAYSAKTNGTRQIWMYDFDSKEEYQLTTGPNDKENPCWADNSLHLVYNTTSPDYNLYMLNLNQPEPVQLTFGNAVKHYPYWEKKNLTHTR